MLKKPILAAFVAIFLLAACHKDHTPPPSSPIPTRVKTALEDDGAINYTYDAKWRLIKYDEQSKGGSTTREYVYTDTTVTVSSHISSSNGGVSQGISVYRLDARGLAISMSDPANAATSTYSYNASSQIIRLQTQRITGGNTYSWDNKYFYNSNGDMDSATTWASGTGLITATYSPQYELTFTTTLGNENIGLSFLGASSKHPLKKTTAAGDVTLFTFSYIYDAKGRVTKQDANIGDIPYTSYSFTYY